MASSSNSPHVKFRVKGLRSEGVDPAALSSHLQQDVQRALEPFSKKLALAVGERVANRLRKGNWHRSRNRRFGYYRAWAQQYGFTRKRKRLRGVKSGYASVDSFLGDARKRHRFMFLAKNLDKAKHRVGPDGRESHQQLTEHVREVVTQYRKLDSNKKTKEAARAYLQEQNAQLSDPTNAYTRFLRESRVGVRMMRQAERYAHRSSRNDLLKPNHNPGAGAAIRNITFERAERIWAARANKKRRKGSQTFSSGGYKFGYQTGAWAESWERADVVLRKTRMHILAHPSGDVVNTSSGPRSLTGMLKRIVQRQGGNPALLRNAEARAAVRDALDAVRPEWAKLRIRVRSST